MEKLTNENLTDFINDYQTKYKEGFTSSEINEVLENNNIDKEKFYEALGVNTCMIIEGNVITYHCDIIKGLRCVFENRGQNLLEWD